MRNQFCDKNALKLLNGRVACKLAEIHQMLAPGIVEPATADELQARADSHMAALSPPEREKLRLRALVAYAELERLSGEMAQQLHTLTEEMKKATSHKRAALAYRQTPRPTSLRLAGL